MKMIAYALKGMQVNICLLKLQSLEMGCSDVTSGYPVFTMLLVLMITMALGALESLRL